MNKFQLKLYTQLSPVSVSIVRLAGVCFVFCTAQQPANRQFLKCNSTLEQQTKCRHRCHFRSNSRSFVVCILLDLIRSPIRMPHTMSVTAISNVSPPPQLNMDRGEKQLKPNHFRVFFHSTFRCQRGAFVYGLWCSFLFNSSPPFRTMSHGYGLSFIFLWRPHSHTPTPTPAHIRISHKTHFKIQTACTGFKLNRELQNFRSGFG